MSKGKSIGIWVGVGIAAVIVMIIIMKSETATTPALNSQVQASASLGGFLAGLFSGGGPSKVQASSAGNIPPGYAAVGSGYDPGTSDYNGQSPASYGAAYSAAMGSTGAVASASAGSGGTNAGGGLTGAQPANSGDPLGLGSLTAPSFDVGTGGADFSN